MPTHVALLRGINVGGRNKVAMADLRAVLESLGYTDVATYIQSGNAVFTSEDVGSAALSDRVAAAIAERLDVRPAVVVLSRDELGRVIAGNPFADEPDPKRVHAVFRRDEIPAAGVAAVAEAQRRAAEKGSRDRAVVAGRTVYLLTPDGLGRSLLAVELDRAAVVAATGSPGTARNWATVTKLAALLAD